MKYFFVMLFMSSVCLSVSAADGGGPSSTSEDRPKDPAFVNQGKTGNGTETVEQPSGPAGRDRSSNALEYTDLGRAVIEGKPKAFEEALWELRAFNRHFLDDVLRKTTKNGQNILDLFIQAPENARSYFNNQLAYFMLHLAGYDTEKPPAQLTSLLDRARKAKNEMAIEYLSNLQKFYGAIERSSLQEVISYLETAKERYKGKMKSSVVIGIPAALIGYQLVYSSFGFDFTKEDIVNVVLPFITDKTVGAVVLAGAAAMGLRTVRNCFRTFSARRQINKTNLKINPQPIDSPAFRRSFFGR